MQRVAHFLRIAVRAERFDRLRFASGAPATVAAERAAGSRRPEMAGSGRVLVWAVGVRFPVLYWLRKSGCRAR